MKKIFTSLFISVIVIQLSWGQSAIVTLRPTHADISLATSEGAVLMTLSSYSSDDVRYRLYSGSNQYNCWDEANDVYVTSTSYASGPLVPGTPTTSTTFWILYQRGNNNSTVASYRDRLGPTYGANYQTVALPTATSITTPFTLSGTFVGFGGYDNSVKHVVLGFSGSSLITAASTTLSTGAFSLVCPDGTTIDKIEIRAINNTLITSLIGSWNSTTNVGNIPAGGNSLPEITNLSQTPSTNITSSSTVSVSADVTDSDGTVTLVELHWGTASGSLTNTITMSLASGNTYTTDTDIPAQAHGTTVYYAVYAEDNDGGNSTSPEQNYKVFDPQTTTLPYNEAFGSNLGQCYTYSVLGATKFWVHNAGGWAQMNGYNSGETEEDWLVLPAINLSSYSNESMTFDTWYNFGTDDDNNYLKLFYSSDYPGIGNPTGSTWTELTFTHPGAAQTWTSSGTIDLSGIAGTSVYIAFKYRYENSLWRLWEVDNISIIEGVPPLAADFTADYTTVNPGGTVNFTDATTGGSTPYAYEWDLDGDGDYDDAFTANPSWVYNTPGTYTIRLRVTDDDLTVDTEIKIDYIEVLDIAVGMIINEVDSDTPGTDVLEFVELYDGGAGNTDLTGLVVVFYNGGTDLSYAAYDLDGFSTDANGYFLLGNIAVIPAPSITFGDNFLQNGPDAVALYVGDASNFPNNTPVTTTNLLDALVYDTSDPDDPGLLVLLNAGQPQIDENAGGNSALHSNQRIPNGSGGQRNTTTYVAAIPTPGAMNDYTTTTWTGASSSDWATAGNWVNGVPNNFTYAVIPSGTPNDPVISGTATARTLDINSGASLEIAASGNLTVSSTFLNNGGLTIRSGASATGSLITSSGVTGTIERYFTGNGPDWHLVSSPVSGAQAGVFLGMFLQQFDPATYVYTDITDVNTPLNVMEGYALYSTLGNDNTVSFTGSLNAGNQPKPIVTGFDSYNWNLVGNPYPSSIDWDAVTIPMNMTNEVHYIEASTGNDLSYVQGVGGSGSRYIPPMQGFFVSATGSDVLQFTDAVRTHAGKDNFYKNDNPQLLILEAAGENFRDETWVHFNEVAGMEHDGRFDAYKRISYSNPELPQLFSYTPTGEKLSVNGMPQAEIVPAGFTAVNPGTFTISASETGEFTEVILTDLVLGMQTDLVKDSYTFSYEPGSMENRFTLQFKSLATPEITQESRNIFAANGTVYILSEENNEVAAVYNMTGQQVASAKLTSGMNEISIRQTGNYVVKVISSAGIATKKVFIK